MLKKVHIKIKKYIFRKHFQKKDKEIIKKCEDQTDILRYLARKYKITEFVITMYREMGQRQGQIKFDKEK